MIPYALLLSERTSNIVRVPSRLKALASVCVVTAILVLAVWKGSGLLSSSSPVVRARPIEGRLSGDLEYAPFDPQAQPETLQDRRQDVRKTRGSTAGQLDGRSLLALLQSKPDQAVQELQEALLARPRDGRLLNDLAVAYLARARAKGDPFDLIQALSAADQAVTTVPILHEALFNRALALEKLHLRAQARAAWEDYLRLKEVSGWAREALARHAELSELDSPQWDDARERLEEMNGDEDEIDRIAASFPLEGRLHVEEVLLGAWADAVRTGRGREASQALAVARRIATALAALHGEHMPADAIAAIEGSAGDPERRAMLVEAHRLYREARTLHGGFRFDEARPLFERAGRGFARGRSPAESLAALYLAVGYLQQQELPTALKILRQIARDERSRRSPGLLTRVYRTMGITLLVTGEPAMSLDSYRAALSAARKAGAVEDEAAAHAVFAENYRYLGRPWETWKHLHEALALTPKIRAVSRLNGVALEMAEACTAAGELGATRYFRDESVRVTREAGESVLLSHALLLRARTLHRLEDREGARRDLDEAERIIEQIPDEKQRQRNAADFFIAESEIDANRSPAEAIRALTLALDFYTGRENHLFLSRLYLARARAELALGEAAQAEEDLRKGIEDYEIQRRRVPEEPFQISFFDQSDSLFDEMVRLQANHPGGEEVAFDFAERDRARSLLDRLGPLNQRQRSAVLQRSSEPLSAREIRQRLPAGVALIEYALVEDQLLAWVVRRDGFSMTRIPVQPSSLDALVKSLPTELARSSFTASARLYDLLIRPVLPRIAPNDQIVFIPDGVLHAVPFAALLDLSTRRHLFQDYVLAVAPSATFYVEALDRDCALRSDQAPTVLAVGNPAFNPKFAPTLLSLPDSEVEAAQLANLFPGSETLTGSGATQEAILSAASRHEIVHFGGHATVNRDFPLLSHLLLAPEDQDDSGLLYAHELYRTRLGNVRLAVLAACRTASGPIQGEGVQSLARAFLAAGVPGVVASLWDVEDAASARFVQHFYQHLRQGDHPPVALRRAQLSMFGSSDPAMRSPAVWAGFEVVGGSCFSHRSPKGETGE